MKLFLRITSGALLVVVLLCASSITQPISVTAQVMSAANYAAGGGTANAQTATYSPAVTALQTGLQLFWLPSNANTTTTPTFAPNGLTAKTIVKVGGAALAANDLTTTAIAFAIYDGTNWELQNPQTTSAGSSAGAGLTMYSVSSTSLTGTQYFAIGGGAAVSTTEAPVELASPAAATVSNLSVNVPGAGLTGSIVFTVRDNTSGTALTCTVSLAISNACTDTTHSFSAAKGDKLDVQAVTTGSPSSTNVLIAVQFGIASSSGGTALPNYSQSFTSQTSVTLTDNAGTTAKVVECYDGSGNAIIPQNIVLTDANNTTVTFGLAQTGKCVVNSSGISTAVQNWQKVTVGFAQLTTAGLTQTINLITTAARTKVCGVSIKTTAAFSGGLIASLTVSVGDAAGTGLDYAPAFTVFSAPSNTNYQDTVPATVASKTSAASTITALFTSTIGNLNTATAGSVDIDVCTAVIP